jgi:hypothetical protein
MGVYENDQFLNPSRLKVEIVGLKDAAADMRNGTWISFSR